MDRKEFFLHAFQKAANLVSETRVAQALEQFAEPRERPPGAAPEKEFRELCTGCDACMAACPVSVIMIDDLEKRHPVIYPERDPCIHCEDTPCIAVCETGALKPNT